MLEKLPHAIGTALAGIRPGLDATVVEGPAAAGAPAFDLASPAFPANGPLPARFTADGDGVSPPLAWSDLPDGTRSIALIVEDADSPTPAPLVHAIVLGLDPAAGALAEGAMVAEGAGAGRNSFGGTAWLPPDPPPGHGPHRYVFQLFALSAVPSPDGTPGRSALRAALDGRVLGKARLVGTYERP